ncbi:MAG TPA: sigma 54-interacting transcriptional regulator [Syntrophomonadaceae bacterium]|nr:sigma 54-interacting transcriptional regulator [Syntrophomonadaceae bacterium]
MSVIKDNLSEEPLNNINHSEILHILLESPYEGIIYVDENGIVRFVNDSYAKYNNISKETLLGHKYSEYEVDQKVLEIQKTRVYEPFSYYFSHNRSFIASRKPVFKDGQFAGVCARYFSLSSQDVNKKFGPEYIDMISQIQIRDIMVNLERAVMELNTYRDDMHFSGKCASGGIDSIIGNSPAINHLKNDILRVADSPSSVLITGESGTGKELIAQAIHCHGSRSSRPFIKVNCAAIPDTLLESELFGYSDGAFTGARKGGKMGKFELANGGTIFLDEIGDMPLAMQAKLLRVLQEREFERLGSESVVSVDIRVISATNQDLLSLIKQGQFREDLYYRLNIISLHTVPLRDRKSDIPLLIDHFIKKLSNKLKRPIIEISPEALNLLVSYDWPGNVRELINALESAINFSRTCILECEDLPILLRENQSVSEDHGYLQTKLENEEEKLLVSVLNQCDGNRKQAAEMLNVSKSTLYRMMKKYDLL